MLCQIAFASDGCLEVVPLPPPRDSYTFVTGSKALLTPLPSPGGKYRFPGVHSEDGKRYTGSMMITEGRFLRKSPDGKPGRTWILHYPRLCYDDVLPLFGRIYRVASLSEGKRDKMRVERLDGKLLPQNIPGRYDFCAVPLGGSWKIHGGFVKLTEIEVSDKGELSPVAKLRIAERPRGRNEVVEVRVGDVFELAYYHYAYYKRHLDYYDRHEHKYDYKYKVVRIVPPHAKPRRIDGERKLEVRVIGWIELTPLSSDPDNAKSEPPREGSK